MKRACRTCAVADPLDSLYHTSRLLSMIATRSVLSRKCSLHGIDCGNQEFTIPSPLVSSVGTIHVAQL